MATEVAKLQPINYLQLVDKLPKMSLMTSRLLRTLSKPNCSVVELSKIAEQDAVLSAHILRTANSAAYGRVETVRSVQHAISIQGVNTLRRFMLAFSVTKLFSKGDESIMFSMARFNLHSLATAICLDILTDLLPIADAEYAFIAGLLHDIGEMLLATNLPTDYDQMLGVMAVSGRSQMDCERDVFGIDHAQLSALAVGRWRLDPQIMAAVGRHHEPPELSGLSEIPLSFAINEADSFVKTIGISVQPNTPELGMIPAVTFPGFDFDSGALFNRFTTEWATFSKLFQ